MNSPSAVVCREIFDENSQPSAEEISDYAQQLGIDPESESHLLPLAKDGLMQALPPPWKAYFDEKIQTHYYYNQETKRTQWEHPLDNVYRELVKKARDSSILDDTCASLLELPTSEEVTKHLERVEIKVESEDDDLTSESDHNETKDMPTKHIAPIGRPPLAPLSRHDKKLSDIQISPLRRSMDNPISKHLMRNLSDRDIMGRFERPKILKQQSEIIDLKMPVKGSEDECFSPLLSRNVAEKGLPLTGKGNMFFKLSKSDFSSPDTEKSLPLDSFTKSDPPKGILREKLSEALQKKSESIVDAKNTQTFSFEEDKKSVRFKLETLPDPTNSPGSNSSSEINDGQSSIISATPVPMQSSSITSLSESRPKDVTSSKPAILNLMSSQSAILNVTSPKTSLGELRAPIVLAPLVGRPPLPPRSETKDRSVSDKDSIDTNSLSSFGASPMRRVVRPPASDYIKPDLFQKNFQKISDLVRPGDIDISPVHLDEPENDKEVRPRSPMIPQKNKISINLMESIESEASIDSPDKEFANLDLNDLDESNELDKDNEFELEKDAKSEENSDKVSTNSKQSLDKVREVKVPKLEFLKQYKLQNSDSDDSKISKQEEKSKSESFNAKEKPVLKISPSPSLTPELRSPRDLGKFNLFKPLSKVIGQKSDSNTSLTKSSNSPRLDGVILSQGKSTDNVVVVYQFESQDEIVPNIKSLVPDVGARDHTERNKGDEKRRLEMSLQKELEVIRVEWSGREKRLKVELQEELRELEEKFKQEKQMRLSEQAERHRREKEETLSKAESNHQESIQNALSELKHRYQCETESAERQHADKMSKLIDEYSSKSKRKRDELEIENESAISDFREQLHCALERERQQMLEENKAIVEALREEHTCRINELKTDYRAEIERLRAQHACHIQDVRSRLADERTKLAQEPKHRERELADKYNCLKLKYARLKHDVKMSIERRNKRREMSMTTGSETEKSNSHKQQSSDRCKELNETSTSAVEAEPRVRNNKPTVKYNDNETSYSNTNAPKSINNNIEIVLSADTSQISAEKQSRHRRTAVAFREPPRRKRDRDRDNGTTTDCHDSSDATTADEKPKESINGHGRRRCFTRLKSASTSRLNYSPKRGEGWSSPLESLRQQLRKLDDLEDQFPDLACQPAYSLRYPFTEFGAVTTADTPELEFVRHRALVEREGMRRARAVLKTRRKALRDNRAEVSHRAPSEEREATELEVALHRARALLGEKEIRLRHIERALRKLAESHPPPPVIQVSQMADEAESSDGSSDSEVADQAAGGLVLRSLKALHADVRDIWRALDARRPLTASPETSSFNAPTTSQTRMTLSAPEATKHDNSDNSITERARGLRAWLQTSP